MSPVVTATSIIICFNKHQLTLVHLEKMLSSARQSRNILLSAQAEQRPLNSLKCNSALSVYRSGRNSF